MLNRYFDIVEFSEYYPEIIGTWITEQKFEKVLKRALSEVATDLREIGIDTSTIYIPKPFDDLDKFEYITKSSPHTSDSIKPVGNETRFVALHQTGAPAAKYTITVQGSQDDSNWIDVVVIPSDGGKTVSDTYANRFKYVRYHIATEGEVKYSPFLVDTAFDDLIRNKAVMMALFPQLVSDGRATELYVEAKILYKSGLSNPKVDIDRDGDGAIDEDDVDKNVRYRASR